MREIEQRLERLRQEMRLEKVDVYLIPTADFHQSEYVGNYFKVREYLTGFTGSAGTAVVTEEKTCLWTDGRYFIQAEKELAGSGIHLMKMGEPGVPSIEEYLEEVLPQQGVLGFDGRVISMKAGARYGEIVSGKNGSLKYQEDLADRIWQERPKLSGERAYALRETQTGESVMQKLGRIREVMREEDAGVHLLTTLDDICWMLNIRGNDVEYTPVVLAYAILTMDKVKLYTDLSKFDGGLRRSLEEKGVEFCAYDAVYEDVRHLEREKILLDSSRLNYTLYANISEDSEKIDRENPEILMKAVKNPTEIANIRMAQIKDSVAHVRFMKWLKELQEEITEIGASEKLDEFRKQMGGFISPSFAPISAYGEHGAIIHYSASQETDTKLRKGGLYLTDTGAHFEEGSTDITRTYVLGEIPEKMKEDFTMVLTGNLRLANARFLKGCTGQNLDILARQPFWERGLDYKHGTGHGVGNRLSIHEGPQTFMWRSRRESVPELLPGMIITDEPGVYVEGSHGIRLENELLVCQGEQNQYGEFLHLETITFVPFDLDGVIPEQMSAGDLKLLNGYHRKVYETVSPYLTKEECEWLRIYTRPVG